MSETKRVNNLYRIAAPTIIIDGNLTVTGSTTSVETVNSTISDNTIILNNGESGAGVTSGTSGIEIDRGSSDNAKLTFEESSDSFSFTIGSSYAITRGAYPVSANDFTTKDYVDIAISTVSPADPIGSVQFSNGSTFGGSADFTWNGTELLVNDFRIGQEAISIDAVNGNLQLAANGTGKIYLLSALRIENSLSDPSADIDSNVLFTKAVGNAGSGVYFTNNTAADELVSRSKAILFGLIF